MLQKKAPLQARARGVATTRSARVGKLSPIRMLFNVRLAALFHEKGRRPKPTPLEVSANPRPGVMKISVPANILKGGNMELTSLIVTLIIGAIAGWLAGVIVEGAGFGLLINVLLGIAGAFIAAFLFPRLGLGLTLGGGVVGAIVTSALGAIVLLLIVNLVQRLAH